MDGRACSGYALSTTGVQGIPKIYSVVARLARLFNMGPSVYMARRQEEGAF